MVHASLQCVYHVTKAIQAMEGIHCDCCSIVVVGVLTCYALLHPVCDLKTAQINMQRSSIQELMLYKFEMGHNTSEITKKDEGTVDYSTVTRWSKKFCLGCKNYGQAISDSETELQDIVVHLESNYPV